MACARSGPTPRPGRGVPAAGHAAATPSPRRVDGPPDWRGLLDLLESRTGTSFDDLWRTWVARDEDLPLLDARRRRANALRRRRRPRPATGSLPAPIRDAMRAWQFEDATALLDHAADVLDQRTAVEAGRGRRRASSRPTRCGPRSKATTGSTTRSPRPTPSSRRSRATRTPSRRDPPPATVFVTLGLWTRRPMRISSPHGTAFARGDLSASASAADEAAASLVGSRGPRARPAASACCCSRSRLLARGFAFVLPWVRGHASPPAPSGCMPTRSSNDGAPDGRGDGSRSRLVRYTRRHLGTGAAGRRPGRARERSRSRLMGLQRARPSHEILSGDSADVYFARAESHPRARGPATRVVTMEVFARQRRACCAGSTRPGTCSATCWRSATRRDATRGARRRRRDRAQGGRPPDPGALSPVRAVRDRRSSGCWPSRPAGRPRRASASRPRRRTRSSASGPGTSTRTSPTCSTTRRSSAAASARRRPAGARLAGLAPTGHDAPFARADLRRHGRGGRSRSTGTSSPEVPRIVLVDTFKDEAEEALRVAHALGDRLYGVRLDTPSERGRVTADLVHEVRARLDQAGFDHVKITVSGGLNPERIALLQGGRGAGRLVRRRVVHQRRDADRLHRRHQGDRRQADRQARPHPRADRLAAARSRSTSRPGARAEAGRTTRATARSVPPSTSCTSRDPREPDADDDRESAYELFQRGQRAARRPAPRAGRDRARAGRPPRARQGLDPRGARSRVLQLGPSRARPWSPSRRSWRSTRPPTTRTSRWARA